MPPPRSSVFASAGLISFCTLLSRAMGMVRDMLTSHVFGAGLLMDAFGLAYLVPNLFRRLFGEGALVAAFVPAFVSRVEQDRRDDAIQLLNRTLTRLLLFLGLLTAALIGLSYALPLVRDDEKTRLIAELGRIMLPYLVFICAAALLGAALNSLRHFFLPAFVPVVMNGVWIVAIVAFRDIRLVAWAVVAGGMIQALLLLPALRRRGVVVKLDPARHEGLGEIRAALLPVVLGLALVQINELVGRVIAEVFIRGDGAVSALYYANTLTQLPLSLIGVSVGIAAFPAMTSAIAAGRREDFDALYRRALGGTLFLALPATIGLIVMARPVVELIFEHGRFGAPDTDRAAAVLAAMSASLWCYCANSLQSRAFYALRDMRTPMRVSAVMVALSLGLNLALVFPLGEFGIGLSMSVSGLVNFLILHTLLARRAPGLDTTPVFRSAARTVAASLVMAAAVWGAHSALVHALPGPSVARELVRTLGPIAGGAVLFFALAVLLRIPEVENVLARFRRANRPI